MVSMLILIPTLIFSFSYPKHIFWQIWVEKVKIIMLMILFHPDRLHCCNLGTVYLMLYLCFVSL